MSSDPQLAVAWHQLFDFYQRGAIAEFVASAFMPFVLLGIRRMLGRQPNAFALTALSYAALTMSHLPLTLLASVFLFVPYALIRARASLRGGRRAQPQAGLRREHNG